MPRKLFTLTVILIGVALLVGGCDRDTPVKSIGTVKANAAYVEHFGQPPTPDKGACFARVGFYPLSSEPGKVRAVPFFLFNEAGQVQQLLDRLVSDEMVLPPESGLINPFPSGTTVRVMRQTDTMVELGLTLGKAVADSRTLAAMAAALTETVGQFEGIEKVSVLLDGRPWPKMPADGFQPDRGRIGATGTPALLMMVGVWEKGDEGPEEILVNFDRPVNVETFRLRDAADKEVKGDYYQSVFDMAVVIHPENPAEFREGMVLKADWEVTDRLDRKGKGSGGFILKRHEHSALPVLASPEVGGRG